MARDVRDFSITESALLTGSCNIPNPSTYQRKSVVTTRSDIVATIPYPDGSYRRVTGYHAYFLLTTSSPGSIQWYHTTTGCTYKYEWTGGDVAPSVYNHGCASSTKNPSIPSWCVSQVRAMMSSQVRGAIDVSTMVGEAKETVLGLAAIFGHLSEAFRSFRQGPGGWSRYVTSTLAEVRANGRGKTAAQAYLAWIYGLKPLISDAQRIMDNWDQIVDEPIGKPLYANVVDSDFKLPVNPGWRFEGKASRGVSSGAYAHVLDAANVKFAQLGLLSPLSVAWELTTLSFVVDWFFHIGTFIRTWEGTFGVAIRDYWETRWVDNKFDQFENRFSRIYASRYTKQIEPHQDIVVSVRLKAMNRIGSPILLPSPPYFSWGVPDVNRALSVFALFLARAKPVWTGDPAKVRLYNEWLRGFR